MTEPSLPELEAERDRLYAQLSTAGDFRRGSVSETYRKCGKPNCACAAAIILGTGRVCGPRSREPRTVGRQLAAAEVEKVRREIARYAEFTAAVGQIVEVNERICEARPAAGTQAPPGAGGRKKGALRRARGSQVRRDSRLAAEAARALGSTAGSGPPRLCCAPGC